MFKGNAAVIVLPLLLMGFIFYGGYHYLNSSDEITNESLDQVLSFVVETTTNGTSQTISGNWDWKEMPIDGLLGDDYIGVKIGGEGEQDNIGEEYIQSARLILKHGGKEIYETNGTLVHDGVVFTFPNELQDHIGFGNMGSFEIVIVGEAFIGTDVSISYMHTWEIHESLSFDQARLSTANVDIDHWIIERFTSIPQP
ncbi:hypothetical protein BTR23_21355 [Alkalihalophilus pseudofirmus]|uniref:hypothetical protein n=1 Tax=Alkalihalobacterium alkalinitrilicum TaxID=427920 RepID=UPI00094DA3F9|nr:hypothetical protein [Alkalihalobacterium alkalinitrilicum]OLO26923.1 hypothetical protein BTR23_21355 [Alkalihalophilus pseudofirmus]